MGLLNNSTNSIILDAVLTDSGRKAIAANNGSFVPSKYSLSDDDVDYVVIKNFGGGLDP